MQNIFVLEDDQELRDTIRQSLQEAGYRVFAASSIREGKDIIEESAFDLAVLDVNLPDGDGFTYCRWLRQKTARRCCFYPPEIWKKTSFAGTIPEQKTM